MFAKSTCRKEDVVFGNFREEKAWSKKALFFKATEESKKKAKAEVEEALVKDVYLCVQPYVVAMRIALDKSMINSMRGEIQRILAEYGGRDILYVAKNASIPGYIARNSTELSPRIFLIEEKCSMSVSDFLVYYKGGLYTPPTVIEEWSGMTEEQQEQAYEEIIKFIRRKLEQLHKNHEKVAMSS